jgi:hypothetical protein
MPLWLQHTLVLALVAVALTVVIRQAVGALRLRHGKLGSCCAKGCAATADGARRSSARPGERIVFLPVESLTRKR